MTDISGAMSALDNMNRVLLAFQNARTVLTALQSSDETSKALAKKIADGEKELAELGIELAGAKQEVVKAKTDAKDIRDKAKADADAKVKAATDSANKRVNDARTESEKIGRSAAAKTEECAALDREIEERRKVIRGLEQTRKDMQGAIDAIIARAAAPAPVVTEAS